MVSTRLLARNISIKFRPLLKERTFLGKKNNGWPNDGSATMQLKAQKFPFHNWKPKKPIKVSTWFPLAQFSKRVTFIPPLISLKEIVSAESVCSITKLSLGQFYQTTIQQFAFHSFCFSTHTALDTRAPLHNSFESRTEGSGTDNQYSRADCRTDVDDSQDSMPRKIKKRKGRGIGAYNLHLRPNIGNTMK